jgi:glutathionylspermidine amidase/synthetase
MNDLQFGKAMGTSTGGVVAYSSDYKTVNNNEYMTRHDFHSYVDGIYLGYKWQCVEFARRWLYVNKGYIFNNVAMAYEIFELTSVRDLATNTELPLYAFKNGATRPPEIGSLLIWKEGGHFEETYHALFMKSAIEAAGYTCQLIQGLDSLRKTKSGDVIDENGNTLRWIWKTWAWETALDDLRFADVITNKIDETTTETTNANAPDLPLNLADVLLNDHIMVFEPLWTLIPSNKAILPVLWRMFPNHSYLLNADYALNDELKDNGYVSKPIVGRCGANIQLVSSDSKTLAEKTGFFDDRPMIYQQLFTLPQIDKQYVKISTFTAQGHYAGCGVRVDSSMIIGKNSDCLPLQIAFE